MCRFTSSGEWTCWSALLLSALCCGGCADDAGRCSRGSLPPLDETTCAGVLTARGGMLRLALYDVGFDAPLPAAAPCAAVAVAGPTGDRGSGRAPDSGLAGCVGGRCGGLPTALRTPAAGAKWRSSSDDNTSALDPEWVCSSPLTSDAAPSPDAALPAEPGRPSLLCCCVPLPGRLGLLSTRADTDVAERAMAVDLGWDHIASRSAGSTLAARTILMKIEWKLNYDWWRSGPEMLTTHCL